MQTDKTALILGATGGIGGEMARELRDAGWTVRAMARHSGTNDRSDGYEWVSGDAMNRDDVMRAAKGCDAIVHAVNPPCYRHWAELVLPMIDNTIAAAIAEHATIILPGTVYNYGNDAFPNIDEQAAQHPLTRKGSIRVEMEQRLKAASQKGCQVIIVRAGDFFGPKVGNSWFAQGLVKPQRPVTTIHNPGGEGIGHQWSYLPDVARTMVALLARRNELAAFANFHMAGHWDADGTQMPGAISRAALRRGGVSPKVRSFPWWLVSLAAPFVPTFRELLEMRYLWRQPVRMSNRKLILALGYEPHTPLDQAVEATLEGMGCFGKGGTQTHPAGSGRIV
ncbi:MAG: SDR family oxidoreductase [Pseudoxanthomonas sp.]